jgi:hypothetical protein
MSKADKIGKEERKTRPGTGLEQEAAETARERMTTI